METSTFLTSCCHDDHGQLAGVRRYQAAHVAVVPVHDVLVPHSQDVLAHLSTPSKYMYSLSVESAAMCCRN